MKFYKSSLSVRGQKQYFPRTKVVRFGIAHSHSLAILVTHIFKVFGLRNFFRFSLLPIRATLLSCYRTYSGISWHRIHHNIYCSRECKKIKFNTRHTCWQSYSSPSSYSHVNRFAAPNDHYCAFSLIASFVLS